jgi:hypothetical protein
MPLFCTKPKEIGTNVFLSCYQYDNMSSFNQQNAHLSTEYPQKPLCAFVSHFSTKTKEVPGKEGKT